MSDNYTRRPPRGDYGYEDRPRSARPQGRPTQGRPTQGRPMGDRPTRPQGYNPNRPQGRPQGYNPNRPAGQHRPPQGRPMPPRRRKKKPQSRFYLFAALAVVLIVALVIGISSCSGSDKKNVNVQATQAPQDSGALTNATVSEGSADLGFNGATAAPEAQGDSTQYSTLADRLADSDAEVEALDESQQIQVEDLSINTNLPSEWMNVLLLGTDERTLSENARTDAILICSINTSTGEVKLSSIMRDTQVEIPNLPAEYGKNFRINAINYFGGPTYTMKFLNEKLNMNMQYYVMVNFFGFSKIASALGGIDIDITEAEKDEINYLAINQAWIAYYADIDESDLEAAGENVLLETFGKNTHLNGRQTLAYARIRHLDSDASRTERQRKVLTALLNKVKEKGVGAAIALLPSMIGNVTTNLDLNTIASVATTVLSSDMSNVETLRIPVNGSYSQETRDNVSMLWDPDWTTNANELYNFIYA